MSNQTILAIDPASKCVGYAVLSGLEPTGLIDAGRLIGDEAPLAADADDQWMQHMNQDRYKAFRRVVSLAVDLDDLIDEFQPAHAVIEIPSGKAGRASRRGAKSSLSIYGMAAGYLAHVLHARIRSVWPVDDRWAPGRGVFGDAKDAHQAMVVASYADIYDPAQDPGADVADAILLGRWWLERYGSLLDTARYWIEMHEGEADARQAQA